MYRKRLGHIVLFSTFEKNDQSFSGRLFVVMACVACIGLLTQTAGFQSSLGEHESEGVAVCIAGFADACHFGHVAANTAAKRMDAVHRTVTR